LPSLTLRVSIRFILDWNQEISLKPEGPMFLVEKDSLFQRLYEARLFRFSETPRSLSNGQSLLVLTIFRMRRSEKI
jgi:hypothetical protein